MNEQNNILNTQTESSFIGLQSYTEAQANKFFGRDKEIEQLTKLVDSNTLTIVFGKSGTGKTSLLNAGVFPRLRKNYCLPFRIRLEFNPDSPDLITQVKNVLKTEIDKYGFKVESYPVNETLWEYFHAEPLWKSVTPILVFDQFEEIFTLAQKNDRFKNTDFPLFWQEMSDLIENSIPEKLRDVFLNHKEKITFNYQTQKVKVLFSFREEYLPEFESITLKIPSIKLSRFRLLQMNGKQAYEVISNTWEDKIETSQAEKIVSYFSKEAGEKYYNISVIEPSLLSQVCTYIEKERIQEGSKIISAKLLDEYPKEKILRSIYEEAMAESNAVFIDPTKKAGEKQPTPMNTFVQEKLITYAGYRNRYTLLEDEKNDKILMSGINVLEKKYFLRLDDDTAELTHDVLAPLIKADREEERKQIAKVIATKKAWRRGLTIISALVLLGLIWILYSFWQADRTKTKAADNAKITIANAQKDSTNIVNNAKIDSAKTATNAGGKVIPGGNSSTKIDTIYINGIDTFQLENLISQLNDLKNNYNSLLNINNVLNSQNSILNNKLKTQNERSVAEINSLKNEIQRLGSKITDLEGQLNSSQQRYNDLKKKYDTYILKYPITFPDPDPSINPIKPEANSLLLAINTGSAEIKLPDNLTIYLIPVNGETRSIIKDAKNYEIQCSENLKGFRKANYYNGQYFYNGVKDGTYLVKICTYYGDYKIYTWKKGQSGPVRLELSPPIQ